MADRLLTNLAVLVIEDEMLIMMAIEDMLADLGCSAITIAGTIEQALDLIANQKFDLATLDVNVNGQCSYAVAEALAGRGVPFAFSTGYGEHGVGEGFGDRPVLTKPYNEHQLVTVLTGLLTSTIPPRLAA